MRTMLAFALIFASATPALARAVKIVEPFTTGVVGHVRIQSTSVTLNEVTRSKFDKLEAKAAAKRAEAKLPPLDPASTAAERPPRDAYPTLPIARMFPLVVEDEAQNWRLNGERAVKLDVEFDTLKTADAGMAMLLGSTDQLAGTVNVADANTGEKLGAFYVDVLNARGGLLGLALRGAGVREKLAFEFSKRIVQTLSGSKAKPPKAADAGTAK